MPILFVCPFCHTRSRVDDRFAGESGPCAECGKTVTIPGKKKPSRAESVAADSPAPLTDVDNRLANANLEQAPVGSPPPPLPRATIGDRSKKLVAGLFSKSLGCLSILVALGVFSVLASFFVVPKIQKGFQTRQRTMAMANIQQIAEALNAYRREHGSYPTPTVVDSAGKPLYSWRVLILPQLGYLQLYKQFQLDQTWDSPTNNNITMQMPPVFACPNNPLAVSLHESNFVLLVGDGTLFPSAGPIDVDKMSDPDDETLLVVETLNGGKKWTEPNDLDVSKGVQLGSRPMVDIGGNYPDCAVAATVDGKAIAIDPKVTGSMLDALITPNGREAVNMKSIQLSAGKETP